MLLLRLREGRNELEMLHHNDQQVPDLRRSFTALSQSTERIRGRGDKRLRVLDCNSTPLACEELPRVDGYDPLLLDSDNVSTLLSEPGPESGLIINAVHGLRNVLPSLLSSPSCIRPSSLTEMLFS